MDKLRAAIVNETTVPRLIASQPQPFGIVWLAEGTCCPCGALVSRHPRPTADGGPELLCANHHTFVRFERP
jgi:hypothetical protein